MYSLLRGFRRGVWSPNARITQVMTYRRDMDEHTSRGVSPASESIEKKARGLLESRITSVRQVVIAREQIDRAEAALAEARTDYKRAWVSATSAGWNEAELKKLGLKTPGVVQRRARASKPDTAQAAPATEHQEEQ